MTFATPGFYWAFAFLVPLIAIYFLKVKPIRKKTNAYFLWEEIFEQKKSTQLFHKIKDLLSLLLLLFAFLCLLFALLEPIIEEPDERKDILLLIDNSFSMLAKSNGQTRLELAKLEAMKLLKGKSIHRNVTIATISDQINYCANKTTHLNILKESLEKIKANITELSLEQLTQLTNKPQVFDQFRIILITDGCHKDLNRIKNLEILKIGEELYNTGITQFDLQRLPGKDNRAGILLQCLENGKPAENVEINLYFENEQNLYRIIKYQTLHQGANIYSDILPNMPSGKWLAKIHKKDSLDEDNLAYAILPETKPLKINVQSKDSPYFITKCIKAFEEYENAFTFVEKNADILITDDLSVALNSNTPTLLINLQLSSDYFQLIKGEACTANLTIEAAPGHRILKYLKTDHLHFKQCQKLTLSKGVVPILVSEDKNAIIFKFNHLGRDIVAFNFNIFSEEFYLNVCFPILMHNTCIDLSGRIEDLSNNYCAGDFINFPKSNDQVEITNPENHKTKLAPNETFFFNDKGFYKIKQNSNEKIIALSVCKPQESNLDAMSTNNSIKPIAYGLPFSQILTILTMALIALELFLYHRRKVG